MITYVGVSYEHIMNAEHKKYNNSGSSNRISGEEKDEIVRTPDRNGRIAIAERLVVQKSRRSGIHGNLYGMRSNLRTDKKIF